MLLYHKKFLHPLIQHSLPGYVCCKFYLEINGQTGEVVSKMPLSIPKVIAVSLLVMTIIGIVIKMLGLFQ